MPRIGRFLFGDWRNAKTESALTVSDSGTKWSGSFKDSRGNFHQRTVVATERQFKITDSIVSRNEPAVLRWHLAPGDWEREGRRLTKTGVTITLSGDITVGSLRVSEALESRYYLEKSLRPLLSLTFSEKEATVVTTISYD